MKRICLSMMTVLAIIAICGNANAAEPKLGFGQVGLYGVPRMARELKMDFCIMQADWENFQAEKFNKNTEEMDDAGVGVILRVHFMDDITTKTRKREMMSTDAYFNRFRNILDKINRKKLKAVTIGEENLPANAKILENLYVRLKKSYPDQEFYQWYTPTSKKVNIPGKTVPSLPSDGWIIDTYRMPGEKYKDLVAGYRSLGKPVIAILWACPNYEQGTREKPSRSWWNAEGWKVFYEQLAVCQRHNVPTTFYMYWTPGGSGTLKWLGEAPEPSGKDFVEKFVSHTVRHVKSGAKISLETPKARPDWIPGWQAEKK